MTADEQREMIALRHCAATAWTYLDHTELLLARTGADETLAWIASRDQLDHALGLLGLFAGARHHITQERTHKRVLADLARELHDQAAQAASA